MMSKCQWKEHKSDTGKIYYHNAVTKESRWTKPKELEEIDGRNEVRAKGKGQRLSQWGEI